MTAFAFLFTVVGVLLIRMFGCNKTEQLMGRYNKADYIGAGMFFIGIITFIVVIFMWMWRELP